MYVYDSPIGRMTIREFATAGHFVLSIEGLNDIPTIATDPHKLADLVSAFALCIPDWDDLAGKVKDVPQILSQWDRVPD